MRAEELLNKSGLSLGAVVAGLPMVLFVLDGTGVFMLAKGKGLEALGLEPGEVVGRSAFEVYRDAPQVLEDVRRALDGEEFSATAEVAGATFETRYSPLRQDGGVAGIVGVVNDITGRVRAEERWLGEARRAVMRAEVGEAFSRGGTLRSILQRCAGAMARHLSASLARIWMLDDKKDVLEMQASAGLNAGFDGGKIGHVLHSRRPYVTNNLSADPHFGGEEWVEREGLVSTAVHPLMVEDELVGAVALFGREPLAEHTLEAMETVMDSVAQGIRRKKTEEELRRQKDLYEGVLAAQSRLGEGLVITEGGRILYANEAFREISGYGPAELESLPNLLGLLAEEDRDLVLDRISRRRRGEEVSRRFNTALRHKDGRRVEIEVAFRNLEGEESTKSIAIIRDIGERKEAEEALRESEERFRQLFEQSADALLVHDENGRMKDCNDAACRTLGYSREELLSLSVQDFAANLASGEEQMSKSGLLWQDATASELDGIAMGYHLAEHRRKDGTSFPVEVYVCPVSYGGKRTIFASARDITRLKDAAEALKESEERFRSLVRYASDIIGILEADGTVRYESPAVERILGFRPGEMIGTSALDYVHPDHAGRAAEAFARILSRPGVHPPMELRTLHKDGSWRYMEIVANNLLDDPTVNGVVVNWHDVTGRKKAEEDLREANRRLNELAVLKADFTAMVAHELDTPLAVIRAYVDMLETGELGPADQARAFSTLQAEAEKLNLLISDVREAATVERDEFTVHPRRVRVEDLISPAAAVAETLPGDHPLTVVVEAGGREVWADPERIGQVLGNLLSNAARYSPEGAPVELRAVRDGDLVRIEVADRGYGIHADDVARIFQKFGRGRDTAGEKVAGAGLGLYLSKRILRAHGSDLDLESTPGSGSVFGFGLRTPR